MRRSVLGGAALAAVAMGLLGAAALGQGVRYVRSDAPPGGNGQSWATALRDVQQAISSAGPGGSVWIARGTYHPLTSGYQLFPNVSLFGGFVGNETSLDQRDPVANVTILSGDVLGDDDIGGTTNDNVLVLQASSQVLANTIVDGFTIRSGRSSQGGGLRCLGSPLIRNCIFTRNNNADGSSSTGAAVYVGMGGAPTPSPRFVNCRFVRNGTMNGTTSGVLLVEGPLVEARIVGCTFVGNISTAQGIVGVRNGANATLVNCAVTGNTIRGPEGSVFLGPSTPSFLNLINCTVAGNTSADGMPGFRVASPVTPVLVRNCVLWGNTSPANPAERNQFSFPNNTFRLDYCRVQGWSGQFMGTGTSAADPMLADLDGPDDLPGTGDEDVRLLAGSSCIDAGNNFYVWADITDIDGDGNFDEPVPQDLSGASRFLDDTATPDTGVGTPPIVDIGAYEHGGVTGPCRADFNGDGVANSQDFFDFLAVFFQGCP